MGKQKKYKKNAVIVVLLLVLCIGGVIAYLTAMDHNTNTFTVGDIDIILDEADVDENGQLEKDAEGNLNERVKGNEYHLIPALTYIKDPTVTVVGDSEDSYVRMIVELVSIDQLKAALPESDWPEYYNDGVFQLEKMCNEMDSNVWKLADYEEYTNDDGVVVGKYEYNYKDIVTKNADDTVLEPLFTSFTVPAEIDNAHLAELEDLVIEVYAHAIQTAGITDTEKTYDENAASAWEKFENSNK